MALSKILPASQEQYAGARNLIINGAMQVAQRGTSSTSDGYQTVDRFRNTLTNLDNATVTQSQSTESPDGFSNSYKMTIGGTAESALAADELVHCNQVIEAQNLQHLEYGTSSPKTVTLSFWVRSSLTGTWAVHFLRTDTSNRARTETYTINSADTWEYKTITLDGDTTNAIANDNGQGISIYWVLAAGSDFTSSDLSGSWQAYASTGFAYGQTANLVGTANATWQITGVQLEVGETATPFEHRSFGDELRRCQRYYEHSYPYGTSAGSANGGAGAYHIHAGASRANFYGFVTTRYTVQKRASATVTVYSYGGTSGQISNGDSGADIGAVSVIQNAATSFLVRNNSGGTLADQPIIFHYSGDAEL